MDPQLFKTRDPQQEFVRMRVSITSHSVHQFGDKNTFQKIGLDTKNILVGL